MNIWTYIYELLGPGLHWGRTRAELLAAIGRAEQDKQHEAAEHLRIILRLRDDVMMDGEKSPRARPHGG